MASSTQNGSLPPKARAKKAWQRFQSHSGWPLNTGHCFERFIRDGLKNNLRLAFEPVGFSRDLVPMSFSAAAGPDGKIETIRNRKEYWPWSDGNDRTRSDSLPDSRSRSISPCTAAAPIPAISSMCRKEPLSSDIIRTPGGVISCLPPERNTRSAKRKVTIISRCLRKEVAEKDGLALWKFESKKHKERDESHEKKPAYAVCA